jgi:hypothetical protein
MNQFKVGDKVTALVTPWTGNKSDGTLKGVVTNTPIDDREYAYAVRFTFSNGRNQTYAMNREELELTK